MMELYLNTVYNLDPGKFLREGRFVILEYSPNFLKEAQPNVMAAPNSSETYMFYLNTQLNNHYIGQGRAQNQNDHIDCLNNMY